MSKDFEKYVDNIKIIEYNMDKIKKNCYNQIEKDKYKHLIMLDSKPEKLEYLSKGDEFVTEFSEKINEYIKKNTSN